MNRARRFLRALGVAGVYVNEAVVRHWQEQGIKDSKRLTSDKRVAELAKIIRETPGCLWTVVPIGPETYNRMHNKMRTVNKMLAWGHARVIENLLERGSEMKPPPERAISDQFARSKSTVADALMELGRELELFSGIKPKKTWRWPAHRFGSRRFCAENGRIKRKIRCFTAKRGWETGGFGGQKTGGNAGGRRFGAGRQASFSQCSPGLGRARTTQNGGFVEKKVKKILTIRA